MKVILFLADGFEEVEALTTVDYLRRQGIVVDTASITDDLKVRGAHNIVVLADRTLADLSESREYDGVIIPGGIPGATNLRDNSKVIEVVREVYNNGKLAAAICAGPIVLERAGIIRDKKVTSYPGFSGDLKDSIYDEEDVVVDGNIITARGPALAVDFAIEIIRYLLGDKEVQNLKRDILYK
ncbi:MAG: DJ-1/PfpI family protein [Tissierellaceae bacterium]|nr:DJ-1/PfpI family protein [Tissierellaceae bacterium]